MQPWWELQTFEQKCKNEDIYIQMTMNLHRTEPKHQSIVINCLIQNPNSFIFIFSVSDLWNLEVWIPKSTITSTVCSFRNEVFVWNKWLRNKHLWIIFIAEDIWYRFKQHNTSDLLLYPALRDFRLKKSPSKCQTVSFLSSLSLIGC